ncbi:ATP-binding cassette, subfamily C, CydC [Cohaesibacter sp. ES.047]|uniref:thiol reductant ABC exporter subunit CydC n=1 Tax=Cohaesibacter sp. ES.047 TaxID=1798205 RepID=UPI000BC05554|nr:thiol reductant ABC exporter subunit CydC [Cohaesibacter sp. ES.047]SNY92705.1 ATP-binding cassette, subfamily C, CydC [Cohaesibacter sp. ES.047]
MTDIFRLLRLMRPWAGWIALGIALSVITLVANVTLMAISGWFIASMALAGLTGIGFNYFTPAAMIRAMAITRTVGRYVERLITHEATLKLVAHLRRWFYDQLEPLAPAGLSKARAGDLFSRIGSDISVLENFYLRTFAPMVVALIALPAFVALASYFSPLLGLGLAALYLVAGVGLPVAVHRLGRKAGEHELQLQSELRTEVVEGLQGMREMLVYGQQADYQMAMAKRSDALAARQKGLANLQSVSQSVIALSANFGILMVLLTMIPLVSAGAIEGPILPMLALFVLASFEAILPLPLAVQSLVSTRMAAGRLFALADQPVLAPTASADRAEQMPQGVPHIECDAISFRYPGEKTSVFKDLSLSLEPGSKLAIVGPSGIGKSSLINALCGFWPLDSGQILIDGTPHHTMSGDQLRAFFAVADQKPHIFNATLRGNLLLANETASDEQMLEACNIARLNDFVETLPKGLDTYVGEAGSSLSGGQVRRLSIARALLSPSPILVLDEPGEGLDPEMELAMLEDIIAFAQQRSIILITHNAAALPLFDQTCDLEQPRG